MTPRSRIPPPATPRLFSDSHPASAPAGVHIAHIDGASRGNPGPAAYAVVLRDPDGKVILELAKKIGRETNNVAEYYALVAALDYVTSRSITALRIRSDSELLVRQMQGRYRVKSPDLKPLYERALKLSRQLRYFTIEHVPREMNRDADALVNVALDSGEVSATASSTFERPESSVQAKLAASAPLAHGPSGHSATSAPHSSFLRRNVRARFVDGALVPSEPLDLLEGAEVELDLRIPRKE